MQVYKYASVAPRNLLKLFTRTVLQGLPKHGINDNTGVMKKFKNQIKELVPSVDFWWLYVLTNLIGKEKAR